jgi:hypothetical protein
VTPLRRLILAALLGLSLTGGLAACGQQNRNGNPEVEDERLGSEERREPPDATGDEAAPTTPGTSTTSTSTTGG